MRVRQSAYKQQGVVLIVGLLMLIVMTLIGLTGMRITTFEERMASNTKDKHMAFEAAESALMDGETYIDNNVIAIGAFDTDGSDGLYDDSIEEIWQAIDWDGTDPGNTNEALVYSAFGSSYGIGTSPKYVLEQYASLTAEVDNLNLDNYGQGTGAGQVEMFRVTARGTGGSDSTVVIIQSTYGKQL